MMRRKTTLPQTFHMRERLLDTQGERLVRRRVIGTGLRLEESTCKVHIPGHEGIMKAISRPLPAWKSAFQTSRGNDPCFIPIVRIMLLRSLRSETELV